jgi:hypothetical protein
MTRVGIGTQNASRSFRDTQQTAEQSPLHASRLLTVPNKKEEVIAMATLLLIVLVLLLIGAVPAWPYNNGWGYYPSGGVGVLVAIVLLLALFGAIPWNF